MTSASISFTLDTEPNESPPEFTLTCRSEGGPAINVTWERDGVTVQEDGDHETSQVIVDTSRNAVYENRLRVRGRREGGNYTCTVSNNFPSQPPSAIFFLKGINYFSVPCVLTDRCMLVY